MNVFLQGMRRTFPFVFSVSTLGGTLSQRTFAKYIRDKPHLNVGTIGKSSPILCIKILNRSHRSRKNNSNSSNNKTLVEGR
jgi:hypothetical protein